MLPIGTDNYGNLLYNVGVEPIIIRTTERYNFKKCRVLWHFNSKNRRNKEPVRQDMNLVFGIAVHKGLEEYYSPEFWDQPNEIKSNRAILEYMVVRVEQYKLESEYMDDEQRMEFDEDTALGREILYYYCGTEAPARDKFTPLLVEHDFQVPVLVPQGEVPPRPFGAVDGKLYYQGHAVMYEGRIDLVAVGVNGEVWIIDHKTASRFDGKTTHLDIDPQVASYAWAMSFDMDIAGVIYNQLLKSPPKTPRVLKSGFLSKDKRQNTTYDLYMEAIEEHGQDPMQYQDFLEYLRNSPNEYVNRKELHRSKLELERQGELIYYEAVDMLNSPRIYPNPHFFECNRCPFSFPCLVAQEKGDVEFALSDTGRFREREPDGG
jgi:hypothetical protein